MLGPDDMLRAFRPAGRHSSPWRPLPRALVVALLVLGLVPATAHGLTYVHSFSPDFGGIGLGVGGDDGMNRVALNREATPDGDYVVADSAGISIVGEDCTFQGPDEARCINHGNVGIGLHGGDDRISIEGSSFLARVRGGSGDDTVFGHAGRDQVQLDSGSDRAKGGAGDDKMSGNGGRDSLSGGPGDDELTGASGRDRLLGNAGSDELNSHDGIRDRMINCGRGRDIAFVDRGIDVRIVHCERVMFASPAGV